MSIWNSPQPYQKRALWYQPIKSLNEPLFPFLVAEQYNLNESSPLQKEFILILTQVKIFFLNTIAADISGGWWLILVPATSWHFDIYMLLISWNITCLVSGLMNGIKRELAWISAPSWGWIPRFNLWKTHKILDYSLCIISSILSQVVIHIITIQY